MLVHKKRWENPQTLILAIALGLIYLIFVASLGLRSIVIFSGGALVLTTMAVWIWQLQSLGKSRCPDRSNLLDWPVFLAAMQGGDRPIPAARQQIWQEIQQEAQQIHQLAQEIAQADSWVIPDLLELLYSIVDRVQYLAQALQVAPKIQAKSYQANAQIRIQLNLDRLHQIRQALQDLHDQFLLGQLDSNPERSPFNLITPVRDLIHTHSLESH